MDNDSSSFSCPRGKPYIEDPLLWRPTWYEGNERNPELLWLDKNENLDPVLAQVTSKIISSIPPHFLSTYPESQNLYRKLAHSLGLTPEQLLLTAGSDGAIRSMFEAFIEPGEIVVHTTPTFAMYSVYSQMYGAKAITAEYQASDRGPLLTMDSIIETIRNNRPRLVCLPNPDSPTGTVFDPEALDRIIREAGAANAAMLVDEAYYPFYAHSCMGSLSRYPHLAICRTFAKSWGLAGLRIGYVAGQPELIKRLHKVRPMYEVNTFSVAAMERMLEHEGEMLASVARLKEGADFFASEMTALGLETIKTHGNFLHVRFGAKADKIHNALSKVVLYRVNFKEPALNGYSRFSLTTRELFKPVVEAIKDICTN